MNRFKSYSEFNRTLKERVIGQDGFELGTYVGEPFPSPSGKGLLMILGSYIGSTDGKFQAGFPNPLNLLIWSILISRFAEDLGKHCTPSQPAPFSLRPKFEMALTPLLSWPNPSAYSRASLKGYWDALIGSDAPEDEFNAWYDFAIQEARTVYTPSDAITRLTVAALLNPYFLVKT